MSDIALSVSCKINDELTIFLLENITDTSIDESSNISKHPIPTGDYVSDTMYKEPIRMSFSGSFGMNGKLGIVFTDGRNLSLEELQKFFSSIRTAGILCDLVKVKAAEDKSPRFTIRKNMALQSISWSEKINSLDFTFNFQQVMQVDLQEYDVSADDDNLPDVEDPKTLNFTDSLLNKDDIMKQIISICKDNGILTDEFLRHFKIIGKDILTGLGVGAVILACVMGGVITGGLGAIVGIAVCVGLLFKKFIDDCKKASRTKINEFRVYANNEKKTKEEEERFAKMCVDIISEFDQLNQKIAVYQVVVDKAQQAILCIDDEYYCFTFTRDNTQNYYGLMILDLDGNVVSGTKTITNIESGSKGGLDQCNSKTSILTTNSGYQVFLLHYGKTRSDYSETSFNNLSEEEKNNLTTYYILVSSIDMGEYANLTSDMIKEYLLY